MNAGTMIYIFKQATNSKTWKLYGVASSQEEAYKMMARLAANGWRAKSESSY